MESLEERWKGKWVEERGLIEEKIEEWWESSIWFIWNDFSIEKKRFMFNSDWPIIKRRKSQINW